MKENVKIRCVHCKKMKNIDDFSWSNKNKGIRNNRCKECQKVYSRAHYVKNKKDYLDTQRISRDRNKEFICNYLKNHPCVDCGENNIIVLQFDHIDPLEKEDLVTKGINDKWSIEKIKKEIDKCDIRCANCHLKRHARENHNYRYEYGD